MKGTLRLSPSKLGSFQRCPREYKFRYVDGLGPRFRRPRAPLTLGANVHSALQGLFALPSRQRTAEKLELLLHQRWAANHAGFRSQAQEKAFQERALEQLRWFALHQDLGRHPFMTETFIQARVVGITLAGRVDRVDKEQEGTLHVIDYKTGPGERNSDPQALFMYALIIEAFKPRQAVSKVSYLCLGDGSQLTWEFTPEAALKTRMGLVESAYRITAEREFPTTPGPFCSLCDFRPICPARAKNDSNP